MPRDELPEKEKEEYLSGGKPRCQAVRNDGEQCRRSSEEDSRYCWMHKPDSEGMKNMVKFTADKKREVIETLEDGKALSLRAAAGDVGVSESIVRERLNKDNPRYDEKFAAELKIARNKARAEVENMLKSLIKGNWKDNKPNFGAIQFALINMSSGRKGWFFPKATKNTMIQQQKNVNESEEMSDDQARQQLADALGIDEDQLDQLAEDSYVDAEFE